MVLYLPCKDGEESVEKVELHEKSRALIFWKGRLIPYAKLGELLPFMTWQKAKGQLRADTNDTNMQKRAVLLLFLEDVSTSNSNSVGVDITKFKIKDDLEAYLKQYPKENMHAVQETPSAGSDFTWAYEYRPNQRDWCPVTKDLPFAVPPADLAQRNGRSARSPTKHTRPRAHACSPRPRRSPTPPSCLCAARSGRAVAAQLLQGVDPRLQL